MLFRLPLAACGFMWLSMCFLTSGSVAKRRRQFGIGQQNGRSPWCVRVCWSKMAFWRKSFPHWLHLYGFSPVWIRKCWFSIVRCRKFLPQYTQPYGFSFVWIRRCCVKCDCWRNRFPKKTSHSVQTTKRHVLYFPAISHATIEIKSSLYKKKTMLFLFFSTLHSQRTNELFNLFSKVSTCFFFHTRYKFHSDVRFFRVENTCCCKLRTLKKLNGKQDATKGWRKRKKRSGAPAQCGNWKNLYVCHAVWDVLKLLMTIVFNYKIKNLYKKFMNWSNRKCLKR